MLLFSYKFLLFFLYSGGTFFQFFQNVLNVTYKWTLTIFIEQIFFLFQKNVLCLWKQVPKNSLNLWKKYWFFLFISSLRDLSHCVEVLNCIYSLWNHNFFSKLLKLILFNYIASFLILVKFLALQLFLVNFHKGPVVHRNISVIYDGENTVIEEMGTLFHYEIMLIWILNDSDRHATYFDV